MIYVLVIDDNPAIAAGVENASFFLEGVTFFYAESYAIGCEIMSEHPEIDIVVIDVHLGRFRSTSDGYVEELRRAFKGVLVGTSADGTFENQMLELGCDKFVPKENLQEYLLALPDAPSAVIYDSPYENRWRKVLTENVLVVGADSIEGLLQVIGERGSKIKLIIIPEEILIQSTPGKEGCITSIKSDPKLLARINSAGFTGMILVTYMAAAPRASAYNFMINSTFVHRSGVEKFILGDESLQSFLLS